MGCIEPSPGVSTSGFFIILALPLSGGSIRRFGIVTVNTLDEKNGAFLFLVNEIYRR